MSQAPTQLFNLTELLSDGSHMAERRGNITHVINVQSGEVVAVFSALSPSSQPQTYVRRTLPSGEIVWSDENTNLAGYESPKIAFSPLLLDLICQKIAEGGSLTRICKEPGMPTYAVLCAWKRKYPEIEKRLDEARADRAEFLRDEAMLRADEATNKNDTPAAALKYEARKWAASTDHIRYSTRHKLEATINQPTIIQVNTGIVREERNVEGKDDR